MFLQALESFSIFGGKRDPDCFFTDRSPLLVGNVDFLMTIFYLTRSIMHSAKNNISIVQIVRLRILNRAHSAAEHHKHIAQMVHLRILGSANGAAEDSKSCK